MYLVLVGQCGPCVGTRSPPVGDEPLSLLGHIILLSCPVISFPLKVDTKIITFISGESLASGTVI